MSAETREVIARMRAASKRWARERDAELTEMEENCFSEYYPLSKRGAQQTKVAPRKMGRPDRSRPDG